MAREICSNCERPVRVCLCSVISKVNCPFDVIILQHPKEVGVYNNTAKLLSLAVNNVEVFVGESWVDLGSLGVQATDSCFLVFPGEGAISSVEQNLIGLQMKNPEPRVKLILLDGTWRQAKRMFRENKWLDSIPKISFENGKYLSNYTIRKEPVEGFLSTLEALVYSVREVSQYENWGEPLLALFNKMVENQLRFDPRKIRP